MRGFIILLKANQPGSIGALIGPNHTLSPRIISMIYSSKVFEVPAVK